MRNWCRFHWVRVVVVVFAVHGGLAIAAPADQVAVAVFANDAADKKYERAVQAKMESLLSDAGLTVLDEEKAKKLKNGWVDLADPGHLVTAEEFVKNAGKYEVNRVYRVSFSVGVSSPLGMFFTASAAAQMRVIDQDAKVKATVSQPMGVKGFPPSDALTSDAAIVNALQRALDSVAEASGMSVPVPTIAKSIPLSLEPEVNPPVLTPVDIVSRTGSDAWKKGAKFIDNGGWTIEEPACSSVSDDGQMGVLGGYSRARRGYGGQLHVVDIANTKEVIVFTMHELGPRLSGENGTSEPFACQFLGNWRYLVAMTGNRLACYDVERGLETCNIAYSNAPKKGKISLWKSDRERYLKTETDQGVNVYRIAFKK
jgi:hypothetical protein